ncbi:MAG: alanine--tRNA ligase [Flavobacteriales bacterium]|nr:MAG: alanine--tRNA ligase [Flavobacteriales bacterium]
MKSAQIRKHFLDFFKDKGHKIVPSAPMVLKNDPTLLFTNAGMVQFKEYFLGQKKITHPRVADTQKCLRVSGKHNDLEEVGIDTYHHTMFEMLGNWSFGDPAQTERDGYFKEGAIAYAWELLTKVYKIDKESLYVTVFEGDKEDGLKFDQEAYDHWKKWVKPDRILNGNKKDNFWEMGAQGPCGPCSEIHVDIRSDEEKAKTPGAALINKDHPQVIEIWNLVFIQYNRKADGSLENLPAKHVDTGMGFERLCMVLQGVKSNYDTDVFKPLISELETITQSVYGKNPEVDIAIRVIVDHIRAVSFSIADGQLPGNTGAGYVVRRILRRAVRYGYTFLKQKEPFIYKLANTLVNQLGSVFPELNTQQKLIENVIREEEDSFLKTLEQGLVLLDQIMGATKGKAIAGAKAFELYDTFGFPFDLTQLIAKEKGFTIDEEGFEREMQKQKQRSKKAAKMETSDWIVLRNDDEEEFVGYDYLSTTVKITKYRKITDKTGDKYQLVFNLTPFYPEGGGQVGDRGHIEAENGDIVYILNTKKENSLIVHYTKNLPINVESRFKAVVSKELRDLTACNHTATHLLHQALRNVLGNHVEQRGSLVNDKHLRFDFSHFSKVSKEELEEIESFVNARIKENIPLEEHRNMPIEKAKKAGALALFGEKYGDSVRTVKYGKSMELCGGTHVPQTGDIWYFKITSESAVAAGIRRIEAITNRAVGDYFIDLDKKFDALKQLLKSPQDPLKSVEQLQHHNTQLQQKIDRLAKNNIKQTKESLKNKVETVNGINYINAKLDLEPAALKDLAFQLGNEIENLFMLVGTALDGKAVLTLYISKNLTSEQLNAGKIVRELGKYIQGGGGGQPFFATAGGKNVKGLETALEKGKEYLLS